MWEDETSSTRSDMAPSCARKSSGYTWLPCTPPPRNGSTLLQQSEPEVRTAVEALLARATAFRRSTDRNRYHTRSQAVRTGAWGRDRQRFRIVGFVGKGGMGEVYQAKIVISALQSR
jgi:hypothetical protein